MGEVIKWFVVPSNLIFLCLIIGVGCYVLTKTKKLARSFLLSGAFLYIICSTGPVSFWLLQKLEYQYSPLQTIESLRDVRTIVVLGSYAELDPDLPLSSRVNFSGSARLVEAMRLIRNLHNGEVIISGTAPMTEIMDEFLVSMGVSEERVHVESNSVDTYQSASNLRGKLGGKRFILVTSAGHMPRAMGVFLKLGMRPIPAPTNYLSKKNYNAISYLPTPSHLQYSDLAVHEYLGILWYRLTGRM